MILPTLGGTPAVWNTCMVFYQAVLLIGYAYAHSLSTWTSRRRQVAVHLVLLIFPFVALPFALGDWEPPLESNPVWAVLLLLVWLVGPPFFVVTTSAPLLQKWFTYTGHAAAKDPYFLYAASNLGSLLALLLYPIAVEPYFSVEAQSVLWTVVYCMGAALVAACGLVVWRTGPTSVLEVTPAPLTQAAPVEPAPAARVLTPATASTAIQTGKKSRRGRAFAVEAAAPAAPAAKVDLERQRTLGRDRLRLLGLASLPLGVMLLYARYIEPEVAGTHGLWVSLWGIYALGFVWLGLLKPWTWLDDTRLTFLVLQPVAMVAAFFGLVKNPGLPPGLWFVLFLTSVCFP